MTPPGQISPPSVQWWGHEAQKLKILCNFGTSTPSAAYALHNFYEIFRVSGLLHVGLIAKILGFAQGVTELWRFKVGVRIPQILSAPQQRNYMSDVKTFHRCDLSRALHLVNHQIASKDTDPYHFNSTLQN